MKIVLVVLIVIALGGLALYQFRINLKIVRRRRKIALDIIQRNGKVDRERLFILVCAKDRSFTRANFKATMDVLVVSGCVQLQRAVTESSGAVLPGEDYTITEKGRKSLLYLRSQPKAN